MSSSALGFGYGEGGYGQGGYGGGVPTFPNNTLPLTNGAPYPLDYYLSLITSEHNRKPKFMATVAAAVQPFVDLQATFAMMLGIFTPNGAGDQLDKLGAWVGVTRNLVMPINGVTTLADPDFQTLIKLAIAQNHWDGTVPGAYTLWNSVFGGAGGYNQGGYNQGGYGVGGGNGIGLLIGDNQDMTMDVVFTGAIQSVVTRALLSGGFFGLRPAGVRITGFYQPSVPDEPIFGFDAQNATVAGFDTGNWMEPLS
jgi:hypothetical protein